MKHLEILNQKYEVIIEDTIKFPSYDLNALCYGEIDYIKKVIKLGKGYSFETLLHEVLHGYLYESGFVTIASDEDLISLFENNLLKILDITSRITENTKSIKLNGTRIKIVKSETYLENIIDVAMHYTDKIIYINRKNNTDKNDLDKAIFSCLFKFVLYQTGHSDLAENDVFLDWISSNYGKIILATDIEE